MIVKTAVELRAEAERLVAAVQNQMVILPADRAAIVDAVASDLADQGVSLQDRLVRIEAQVRTVLEAVTGITAAATIPQHH